MNRTSTIFIGLLFIFAVLGFALTFTPNTPRVSEGTTSYTNLEYGFSFSFPNTLSVLSYTPEIATIGTPIEDGIEGIAEVRVIATESTDVATSFSELTQQLINLCAADGPNASLSCIGLSSDDEFTTTTGVSGSKLILSGEYRTFSPETHTPIKKGPYLVFVLSQTATSTTYVVIHAPLNQELLEADSTIIEAIAASLVIGN